MPEGPEVRVVADVIESLCLGKKIIETAIVENVPGVLHRYGREKPKNWDFVTKPFFIKAVRTQGKLVSLDIMKDSYDTDRDRVLLITLGMSGDFQHNAIKEKHCRYAFKFESGEDLSFIDPRCFGTLRIVTPTEAQKLESKIGWDLLTGPMPEERWTQLKYKLGNCEVGETLLEQKHFAGLGNIYRAEVLIRAGVHPLRLISQLSKEEWSSINKLSAQILRRAYELNGCSVADFTANGKEGQAQTLLKVYGKKTCPENHTIETVQLAGRTMWFCPQCQPANVFHG